MPDVSASAQASRSGLWRAVRGALRWWVVAPLVLVIGYLIALAYSESLLRGKLEQIRARGEPLTLAEMAPKIPLGADNAADRYLEAFDFYPQGVDMERAIKEIAYARSILPQCEPAIELLREASGIPACAFPVNWHAPPASITFPHYSRMREGARLLNAHARVLAADGKGDEALGDIAAMYRMAEHAKADPTLIGLLVGYAMQGITLDALEAVLSAGDASPEACRKLFEQLGGLDHRGPLRRAVLAERAFGLEMFERFRAGDPGTVEALLNFAPSAGAPAVNTQAAPYAAYRTIGRALLNLDEASYLDYMDWQMQGLGTEGAGSQGQGGAVTAAEPKLVGLLGAMMAPTLGRTKLSAQRREAEIATARAALALKAYRAEKGRYPTSLAEVAAGGWQLPKDPFGGAELRYHRERQGFVVYSVGPNLADDNAAEHQPGMSWEEGAYDTVFGCER